MYFLKNRKIPYLILRSTTLHVYFNSISKSSFHGSFLRLIHTNLLFSLIKIAEDYTTDQ